ncbi:MAG: HAD-IA family hydrolase [Pseudorhodobacter sp.]
MVIGGESLPVKKSDPAPLRAACDALPGPAFLHIGDSEVDAETARIMGLPFGLFTEGCRKVPVADLPHAFAFDDFALLPGPARMGWTVAAV